jgi:hypothetical protein
VEWSRALGPTKNADEDDLDAGDTGWEKMDWAMEDFCNRLRVYLLAGTVAGAKSCSYCETRSSSRRPWYVDARHQAALSGIRDTPRAMASHFYCMGPLICYSPYILQC